MKCFYHPTIDAIGICKKCQKGICISCATDMDYGLACKDKHEEDVEAIDKLVSRNVQAIGLQKKSALVSNLMLLILGSVFLGFGLYRKQDLTLILGLVFIAYWLYLGLYNAKVFKKLDGRNKE